MPDHTVTTRSVVPVRNEDVQVAGSVETGGPVDAEQVQGGGVAEDGTRGKDGQQVTAAGDHVLGAG
jgi:hypothetical protein